MLSSSMVILAPPVQIASQLFAPDEDAPPEDPAPDDPPELDVEELPPDELAPLGGSEPPLPHANENEAIAIERKLFTESPLRSVPPSSSA